MIEPAAANAETASSEFTVPPRSGRVIFGIGLILVSGVLWFSLFAVPFLSLTVAQKSALAAGIFVAVQITWWTGAAIAGAQSVQRLKSRWSRAKKDERR